MTIVCLPVFLDFMIACSLDTLFCYHYYNIAL